MGPPARNAAPRYFLCAHPSAIILDEFEEGSFKEVTFHDGSVVVLKKLETDYDPTNKWQALKILEEGERDHYLVTGLIYVDPDQPSLYDFMNLTEEPLNRIPNSKMRPSKESLDKINQSML